MLSLLCAELYNLTIHHLPHSLLAWFVVTITSFFTVPLCFCTQIAWSYANAYRSSSSSTRESPQPGLPPGHFGVAFIGETSSALKHKEQFFIQRATLYGTNVFVTALAAPIVERGGSGIIEFAKRCVCIISNKNSNNNQSLTRILHKVFNEKSTDHLDIDKEIATIVASFFKRLTYCEEAISMTAQAGGLACEILLSIFLGVPTGLDTNYTCACKSYAAATDFDEKQRHKKVILRTIRRALSESRHNLELWTQRLLLSAEAEDGLSDEDDDCYYPHISAYFLESVLKAYKDSEPEGVVSILFDFIVEANLLPLIEQLKATFRAVVPDFSADDTPVALCRQNFAAYMYGCRAAAADGFAQTPMSLSSTVSSNGNSGYSAPGVNWSLEIASLVETERRAFSSDSLAFLDSLAASERARPADTPWYMDIGNFLGLGTDEQHDELSDSVSTCSGISTPVSSLHRVSPLQSSRGSSAFHSIMAGSASAAAPSSSSSLRHRSRGSAVTPSPSRGGAIRFLRTVPTAAKSWSSSSARHRQESDALKQAYVREVYDLVRGVRRAVPRKGHFPTYSYSVCPKDFTVESDNGVAYTVPRGYGVLLVSTDRNSLAELIEEKAEGAERGAFREAAVEQNCMLFDIITAAVVQEMVQRYTFSYRPVFGDTEVLVSNLARINYLK